MGDIKWRAITGIFILLAAILGVGREFFLEEERQARHTLGLWVKENFPKAAEKQATRYGLTPFVPDLDPGKNTLETTPKERETIILIHGLDDPGKVWMTLAPALWKKNFDVRIMTYPNDQPITDSARFLLDQLTSSFSEKTLFPLSIVTHSMGGLVVREMLTSPELSYEKNKNQGKVFEIKTLIMVAPPNQGSHLARFRFFMEVRDQLHQWIHGDYHWLNCLFDGAGEAGLEMIPHSRFLTQLNRQPFPKNLNIQIISGWAAPWSEEQILVFSQRVRQKLPSELVPAARFVEKIVMGVLRTLGDGLVSVDSTRLDGIPLNLVQGTHLTMIRNLTQESSRIPPALPLIINMLTP